MRQLWNKRVSWLLIFLLMFSVLFDTKVLAVEDTMENISNKDAVVVQETKDDINAAEAVDIMEEGQKEEQKDSQKSIDKGSKESEQLAGLLNYVYVEKPYIEAPAEQNIVVSWGDGTENIKDMKLVCQKDDGSLVNMPLTRKEGEVYIFTTTFADNTPAIYQVKQIVYNIEDTETTLELSDIGVEAQFGVNKTYPGFGDGGTGAENINAEDINVSVVSLDGDESVKETEQSITEVLEQTEAKVVSENNSKTRNAGTTRKTSDGSLVVVLDPGHGGTEPGASGNGLLEKELNLKIAQYCKAELEQYSGVKVYMTRESDVTVDLNSRVQIAKNYGADVLVSIHLNSATPAAHGAEVWYPNANYNSAVHQQGQGLAQQIQNQLVALGLADRGIQEKSTKEDKYPDGSLQDWYSIIRNSKLNGFPGIIVEHAFLSNSNNANDYLGSDAKLQRLGVADATGIANYYGLSKSKPNVEAINENDFAGVFQLKVVGCGIQSYAAVWSAADQSDLKWYPVSGNNATVNIDIKNHQNLRGDYNVHIYNGAVNQILCNTVVRVSKDISSKLTAKDETGTESQYKVTLDFAEMPSEIAEVKFATWCDPKQKDLLWYQGKQTGNGKWESTIDIKNHKLAGKYNVHAYVKLKSGLEIVVNDTTFQVTEPKKPNVKATNYNKLAGTFDVIVDGIDIASGVNGIKIPVWCASNQSDIVWYDAVKQSDGTYKVNVSIANHNYATGVYSIHMYLTTGNGLTVFQATTQSVQLPDTGVSVTDVDKKETKYAMQITNAGALGNIRSASFAVWSEKDGQDDLIWYEAIRNASGVWTATADISNHRTEGSYVVHAYVVLSNGTQKLAGSTGFDIGTSAVSSFKVENYNKNSGTFDVVIKDISSISGIKSIKVPVWCASNQSDIVWYDANRQSDGSYKVNVSIANHNYATGVYNIHMYLTTGNGLTIFKGITQGVELPNIGVSAADTNGKETTYSMNIANAGTLGDIKSASFAVWSEIGGQDDIVWYEATKNASGIWTATANINNHRTEGAYAVHAYVVLANGVRKFAGGSGFKVTKPNTSNLKISNYNKNTGTFDVIVEGISSVAGVKSVKVPVWSAANQSDIVWYDAIKQTDGSYKAGISMANHGYATGVYNVHMYLTTENGLTVFKGTTQGVELPDIGVRAFDTNAKETTYAMQISNAGILGNIRSARFAVWSQKGGQDDIVWYTASKNGSGLWTAEANINNHKTEGQYFVHAYVVLANGVEKFAGNADFKVTKPDASALKVTNYNKTAGTFDVTVDGISSVSGVRGVKIPVWCASNQSDIVWYDANRQSDGSYKASISMANHNYATGVYNIHMYLTTENGLTVFKNTTQGVQLPNIGVSVADTNGRETSYVMNITNAGVLGNVRNARFAVWSDKGGQDDIVWYEAGKNANGVWTATANINNHKTEGNYEVHAYVLLENGTQKLVGNTEFNVSGIKASVKIAEYNGSTGSFKVIIDNIQSTSGIARIQVPVWSNAAQSDMVWYEAKAQGDGSYAVTVDPINHNYNSGLYQAHVYVTSGNGQFVLVGNGTQMVTATNKYTIMGDTTASVAQMVSYFARSGHAYPAAVLGSGGAGDITTFCTIYAQEAAAEGVRAEVAFTQAMKETGWLQYGGIVKVEQFNFAGIGALDGNSQGNCASFPDVRTGIRAQIQHLKAYGSTAPLVYPCVDPRFHLVTRNSAPYVEWLGIKENPYGLGWATGVNYGPAIVSMVRVMKSL